MDQEEAKQAQAHIVNIDYLRTFQSILLQHKYLVTECNH